MDECAYVSMDSQGTSQETKKHFSIEWHQQELSIHGLLEKAKTE